MSLLANLTERDFFKILIALAVYVTSITASNVLGLKLMPFLFDTNLSVAVFSFPVVFIMLDVIGEVYGKRVSRMFFIAGLVTILLFTAYTVISLVAPFSDKSLWVKDGYNAVFGISLRVALASVTAFAIAEHQDILSFFFFRRKLGEKNFWLRSNLSNLWSQLLDTVIFMLIAFYGVYPNDVLITVIFTWWLYKVAMGVLYTPLSYVGIYLLRDYGKRA